MSLSDGPVFRVDRYFFKEQTNKVLPEDFVFPLQMFRAAEGSEGNAPFSKSTTSNINNR